MSSLNQEFKTESKLQKSKTQNVRLELQADDDWATGKDEMEEIFLRAFSDPVAPEDHDAGHVVNRDPRPSGIHNRSGVHHAE